MRVLIVLGALASVRSQDPLAGDFYNGPPPGPPPIMQQQSPSRGMRPFFGSIFFMAAGAGAMKAYDVHRERKFKKKMDAVETALDFKRIETNQLSMKVQTLEYQIRELQQALYESEAEALQRDYDEFKAPDLDDDDYISAEEFAAYISNYMKAYPLISEDEYPVFADFDIDRSGAVTFKEWQHYLQQQQKQKKEAAARTSSSSSSTRR